MKIVPAQVQQSQRAQTNQGLVCHCLNAVVLQVELLQSLQDTTPPEKDLSGGGILGTQTISEQFSYLQTAEGIVKQACDIIS